MIHEPLGRAKLQLKIEIQVSILPLGGIIIKAKVSIIRLKAELLVKIRTNRYNVLIFTLFLQPKKSPLRPRDTKPKTLGVGYINSTHAKAVSNSHKSMATVCNTNAITISNRI